MTDLHDSTRTEVAETMVEKKAPAAIALPHLSPEARTAIPPELQALPQWITWKAGPAKPDGKFEKYPSGRDGTGKKWVEPQQWMTFDHAISQAQRLGHSGIGIVLPAQTQDGLHLVALDFDTVDLSPAGLQAPRWQEIKQWCDQLDNPYTETSPSGAGVRMLLKSKLPQKQFTGVNPNGGKDEVFSASVRWVTITGNHLTGQGIPDSTAKIAALGQEWAARGSAKALGPAVHAPQQSAPLPPTFQNFPAYYQSSEVAIDLLGRGSYPPAPGMVIVEEACAAIRALARTGGTETEWSLGILNTARFTKEKEIAAHAWSKAHPNYSEAETDRKFEQRKGGIPPTSCQAFAGFNAECAAACARCEYREKATTPIHAAQMLTYAKQMMFAILPSNASNQPVPVGQVTVTTSIDPTDAGNAEWLLKSWGGHVVWVAQSDTWLEYDANTGWCAKPKQQIVYAAELYLRELGAQCFLQHTGDSLKKSTAHVAKSLSRKGLNDAVDLLKGRPKVLVHAAQLDADDWLLGVKGGMVVDLRSRRCRRQTPDDYVTKSAGCFFDADAIAPLWKAFLLGVFEGDMDRIGYLQLWMGYVLTGSTTAQQILFAYGLGANGKSVLFNVIQALMGSYATTAPVDTFMMSGNEGPKSYLTARLEGARLVISNETADGQRFAENLIKELTGGEKIAAAHKYQNLTEFTPKFKLAIVGNHKPVVGGTDNGIWRRLHLLPFNRTYKANEQDPNLVLKLLAELPGILNWALEGCELWQQVGLTLPPVMTAEVQAYRSESDVIGNWISENCIVSQSASSKSAALFSDYKRWCENNGHRPASSASLGRRLSERGFTRLKSGTVSWQGIEPRQKAFGY
jgi:P4 family phage/plasmid primase-like protien